MTPKQQHILDRAKVIFGEGTVAQYNEVIVKKITNTFEVELLPQYADGQVQDLLNDIIYNPLDSNLFSRYIFPPFSVLDTKSGTWLSRRRILDDYIGDSLEGRDAGLVYGNIQKRKEDFKAEGRNISAGPVRAIVGGVRANDNGTSQFDSVLCELILKWFGFAGCKVLDPFAGGVTRGLMANLLGYEYTGFDLNKAQLDANYKRALELGRTGIKWLHDDSMNLTKNLLGQKFDLIFSCPPYGDLEQYTDDPRDLSNMDYDKFANNYTAIIHQALDLLTNNRFAVFVVGDFRDDKGFYRNFVADTIYDFCTGGAQLYNEAILLNAIGSASMRANGMFGGNRKLVKVHQNVLVFYKGDPKQIKLNYTGIDTRLPLPQKPKGADQLF